MRVTSKTIAEWRSLRSVVSLATVWKRITRCESQPSVPCTTQGTWLFAQAKVAQTSCQKRTTQAIRELIRAASTQSHLTPVRTRVAETTMTRITTHRLMKAAMRATVRQAIRKSSNPRTIWLITRLQALSESTNFVNSIATVMTRRFGSIGTLLIAAKISLITHRQRIDASGHDSTN